MLEQVSEWRWPTNARIDVRTQARTYVTTHARRNVRTICQIWCQNSEQVQVWEHMSEHMLGLMLDWTSEYVSDCISVRTCVRRHIRAHVKQEKLKKYMQQCICQFIFQFICQCTRPSSLQITSRGGDHSKVQSSVLSWQYRVVQDCLLGASGFHYRLTGTNSVKTRDRTLSVFDASPGDRVDAVDEMTDRPSKHGTELLVNWNGSVGLDSKN